MAKFSFESAVAAIVTSFIAWLGGWDITMKVLAGFMIMDYASGVIGAIKNHKVNSDVMFWGGMRKGAIFAVIILAVGADYVAHNEEPIFRTLAIYFYVAREGLSIVENLGLLGVPFPEALKKFLVQLNEKGGG